MEYSEASGARGRVSQPSKCMVLRNVSRLYAVTIPGKITCTALLIMPVAYRSVRVRYGYLV